MKKMHWYETKTRQNTDVIMYTVDTIHIVSFNQALDVGDPIIIQREELGSYKWFITATLSQIRTWISNVIFRGVFFALLLFLVQ